MQQATSKCFLKGIIQMTYKLIKRLTITVCLLLSFVVNGPCNENCDQLTISQYLINKIHLVNENESYTAILLLSHVALEEKSYRQLADMHEKEKSRMKKLFIAYTLSVRTQEPKYTNSFIDLYPVGKDQQKIWRLSQNLNYIAITTPLQKRLAGFAPENEKALWKLLSSYDFADGANLTALLSQLFDLYKRFPEISKIIKTEYPRIFKTLQEQYSGRI